MGRIVNVAVVGYGGMGGWHTRRLQEIPEVHLAGVYDILPERNQAAEEVGIHAYSSYERRLRDCSGGKPLDIYLGWLPLALLDPLNQAIALFHVQLCQQFQCLIVAAAQVFTDFLGGVVDIDPPFFIVPTVLCGKAHSIQHEAIQQLRFRGQPFEPFVTDQGAWDAVKAELTAFIAVVVIENLYIAHLQLSSYC